MIKNIVLKLIEFYQKFISPLSPPRCRYYPTCSAYAKQAIVWHGVKKGLPMAVTRVCRCHPWGGSGIDFVPLPMYLYRYHYVGGQALGVPWRKAFATYADIINLKFKKNN